MKQVLVTGGAGYIGSHVVVELVQAGFRPVIVDNFSNSDKAAIKRLEKLLGQPIAFYEADYQDATKVQKILQEEPCEAIIHIAAFKAVGESVENPLKYYQNNVAGFVGLLEVLQECHVQNFVFSSSAAVYGNPSTDQVTEETPCAPESPYGQSKYMDEVILRDTCAANPRLHGVALRYFNVVGSHESYAIGESPKGKPQNLLPLIVQAVAQNKPITVFGTDYPTPDGTCLRDYIHVVDLAKAHVAALQKMLAKDAAANNYNVYCLGTGKPTSVLELITAFEEANGIKVPYTLGPRRPGDPTAYFAIAQKANRELGWRATYTIEDAVKSAWRWHQQSS